MSHPDTDSDAQASSFEGDEDRKFWNELDWNVTQAMQRKTAKQARSMPLDLVAVPDRLSLSLTIKREEDQMETKFWQHGSDFERFGTECQDAESEMDSRATMDDSVLKQAEQRSPTILLPIDVGVSAIDLLMSGCEKLPDDSLNDHKESSGSVLTASGGGTRSIKDEPVNVKRNRRKQLLPVEADSERSLLVTDEHDLKNDNRKLRKSTKLHLPCSQCDLKFANNSGLSLHIKTVHRNLKTCKRQMKYHVNVQHTGQLDAVQKQQPRLLCPQCDQTFAFHSGRNRHVRTVHRKLKPYKCPECDQNFAQKHHMEHHVSVHHTDGNEEASKCKKARLSCPQCDKTFAGYSGRFLHIRTVHRKLKPYQCQECEESFAQKHQMEYHVNAHHTGAKPFKCKHCGLCFSQHSSRNYHQQKYH